MKQARDAESAIRGRDGYDFDGHRLRVELAHGGRGRSSSSSRYGTSDVRGRGGVSRRSDYRVLVSGLPSSASWQDLKDHMRKAGDVCFSDVYRDRDGTTGVVDYTNYDDMRHAITKLDGSEFRNAFSRKHIRVKEYSKGGSRSISRSPSYSRGRSHSRGRISSRSRSRSRSNSPKAKSPKRSSARHGSRSSSKSRSVSRSSFMNCSIFHIQLAVFSIL
ncbi:hypothetical protein V2J09_021290 [Rumex salicifolius]